MRVHQLVALALTAVPCDLVYAQRSVMESPAALTSLVLVPSLAIDVFSVKQQRSGGVSLGGELQWLPKLPVLAHVAVFRAMDAGGQTNLSSFEIGGSWRARERLQWADKEIFVTGHVDRDGAGAGRDLVHSTYLAGQTVLRRFDALRGGLTRSHIYESGGQPSNKGHALYVGVARNELANDPRGALGLKYVKMLAVDLMIGGADSTALGDGKGRFGYRGIWRSDFGIGSAITSKFELGSRPAQGFYMALTMDLNIMLLNVGRF
jgi:hypothetical protein